MSHPFSGPCAKLDRENLKLVELEQAEREFFQANPVRISVELDPQTGHKLAKLFLDVCLPDILHILAGEAIYHMRSSLDQIAVALARMSVAKPNPKKVHFPCGDNAQGFRASCDSNLAGFDQDFIDHIADLKIYDGANDTLRAVFQMANIDKHMEVIGVAANGGIGLMSHFTIQNAHTALIIGLTEDLHKGVVFSDLGTDGTVVANNPMRSLQSPAT